MSTEVKIIIRPIKEGFAMFIVEPKENEPMSDHMMSCYTLARGMIKFGLDTPDEAFDYGLTSFREEEKQKGKANGGDRFNMIQKIDNIIDITALLKKKKP